MFERFVSTPWGLKRHREAPMAAERERYLRHLIAEGRSYVVLRQIVGHLRRAAELLALKPGQLATLKDVRLTGERWLDDPPRKRRRRTSRHVSKTTFIGHATDWLRFIGRLQDERAVGPFDAVINEFIAFGRSERGLAPATLTRHQRTAEQFFQWFAPRGGHDLSQLDADDLSAYAQSGPFSGWLRRSIASRVSDLRVLLRWLGSHGRCSSRLAECIQAPRIYTHERYPVGPSWTQVVQLVGSARGTTSRDIRDRAILLLLSVYGFRVGEVRQLRLEDINWERETIAPRRPKQRKVSVYPLTRQVGEAIIAYFRTARPTCSHRHVFLSLRQPYRPLSGTGLGTMVQVRQKRLGQRLKRYGPHGLRHACATYLLAEGFTLKQIGDHLGHSMVRATEAYAKVDLAALRQVGEFEFPELLACEAQCADRETPFHALGELDALRTVADLSLQELL